MNFAGMCATNIASQRLHFAHVHAAKMSSVTHTVA
jgi:hypothetical protein